MANPLIPHLPDEYEPTRATLHAYARGLGAIPRAHGIAHPKWWHVSLKPRPEGLATDPIPLPDGGTLGITMDLVSSEVVMRASNGARETFDMRSGATATEFAGLLIAAAAGHGLDGAYDRARFESDDAREYLPAAAAAFGSAFTNAASVLERHRATLGSRVGPVQVWPHGFDLAFEWFGTTSHEYEGEVLPSQIDFGWYPAGRSYFYANPWPFAEVFGDSPLPAPAGWHTDGWQGSLLYPDLLEAGSDQAATVAAYLSSVHEAARPLLES